MISRIPFPVIATHDIRKGHIPMIKTGTAGEITGISGAPPPRITRSPSDRSDRTVS